MIKSLTYEILKKVWSDKDLSGSLFDQLVEVAVREGERRQTRRIEALEAENERLREALDNIANESSDTWAREKARAALAGDSHDQ